MYKFVSFMATLFVSGIVLAGDAITVKNGPLDHTILHVGKITRDAPVHVHLFDTSGVKLEIGRASCRERV